MSKWLAVLALVLLVLIGTMGLRNVFVANAATLSASNSLVPTIWSNGGAPIPPLPPGGGHIWSNGGAPIPPLPPGGGHVWSNGGAPIPPLPPGGGHVWSNGGAPIPPLPPGGGGH